MPMIVITGRCRFEGFNALRGIGFAFASGALRAAWSPFERSLAPTPDICIMAHMFRLSTAFISQVPGITRRGRNVAGLAGILAVALVPGLITAQSSGGSQGSASQDDPAIRFRLPTVTVTAQKEPEGKQRVPVGVTAVSKETIDSAGIHIVSEAAVYAPNTFFTEWSARKLSNARFRGIISSPNNPGITTYIDGVPQLSANSSSIELLDVNQIEFVRGPQSALFGRNTLGGLVNITSA
ncbi:MAG: TonB-dependent receptor plug domain-containing protein, partial [Luteitalea sp.]|nr:TonB-dependent receptor plug domain-containing protein [Luteitalea sp.]